MKAIRLTTANLDKSLKRKRYWVIDLVNNTFVVTTSSRKTAELRAKNHGAVCVVIQGKPV